MIWNRNFKLFSPFLLFYIPVVLIFLIPFHDILASVPPLFPKENCKTVWKHLIQNKNHLYDFKKEAQTTPKGNLGYTSYATRTQRQNCFKEWTILIYMAADNDLMPYAFLDLYEMEAGYKSGRLYGASTLKTDLVVQLDTPGSNEIRRLHLFQSPTTYDPHLKIEDFKSRQINQIQSPIIQLISENFLETEAERFTNFLEWGTEHFPSQHYMVIVWGHGQGWAPAKKPDFIAKSRFLDPTNHELTPWLSEFPTPQPETNTSSPFLSRGFTGGIAFNDSRGTYLDIPSLKQSLLKVFNSENPLDIYASDACLMQMVEVASEISDLTRFIVGSTQVQHFLGLPYRRLLYKINRLPAHESDPFHVAKIIPGLFKASLQSNGLQGKLAPEAIQTITMSTLSSSELQTLLLPGLNSLGKSLLVYLQEDPLRAVDLQFILQNTPRFQGGAQELGAFLTLVELLLKSESEEKGQLTSASDLLRQNMNLTRNALQRTVLDFALGKKYSYLLGIKALSIWLPISKEDYQNRIKDFKDSWFFIQSPFWSQWIEAIFSESNLKQN